MRKFRIILKLEELYVRCVKCNKRQFIRLPRRIIKTIFYLNVLSHDCDWLEITKDDVEITLSELKLYAKTSLDKTNNEEEYTIKFYDDQIIAKCNAASIDIKLVFIRF